jgi:hypothetical protein
MYEKMVDKLKKINISPIYFVGSGISRRYIETPNWIGLLAAVRNDWNRNFVRYIQEFTVNGICNCEDLATKLEEMYFEKLEDKDLIEGKEKRYYFRKRICDIIVGKVNQNINIVKENQEIKELKKTSPSAIITTNYDNLMEKIFPNYTVYVGQKQLLQNNIDGIGDIYKIHGCISDPNSIVITKKDYESFYKNSHYLNAKLLTLFLEYPTIFMGYSLSDRDVKSILDTIVDMLGTEKSKELSERMWFLRRNKKDNDYEKIERIELNDGRYLDLTVFYVKNFSNFFKVINSHDIRRVPVQFLKYIKANTYRVISSQEFDPKIINANLTDLENFDETKDVMNFLSIKPRKNVVMNRDDLCKAFVERDESIQDFSIIKFKLTNRSIIPIYWNIKNKRISEIIQYIDEAEGTLKSKNELIKKLNVRTPINQDKFYYLSISISYNEKLEIDNINKYLSYLTEAYKLQGPNNQNRLEQQFSLYLINYRFSDLLKCNEYITMYREKLVDVLQYLDKEYIKSNEDKIFELIRAINDDEYSGNFRKALLYIDKCLYKDTIVY